MNIKDVLKQWANTDEHKAKVKEAQVIIAKTLSLYQKPYVAFSGGKDSTCMLYLVLQQKPDVTVLHWDYGPYYIPRWLEKEFIENAKKMGAVNIRIETSPKYERLGRNAINVLGEDYIGKLIPQLKEEGYDLAFVGLRKQESVKRRLRLQTNKNISILPECWPVQNWDWKDVWAFIFSNDLPYASIYDKYAPVVGWDKVRLTTFFDPEFDKFGNSNLDGVLMWRWRHDMYRIK
ncbi:phosphoadenosine phosphosulfate reductase family protein [Caldicoprobacter algeriensis]|uniref:phosphoadenosine phosphosulfate reductase family protein n=1 Tax=Caldicoprobacter algeriensis TaxID=699281 RepID=UPI00207AE152|nr:phosphoadenosine phosphosulfate reductase family protein [Caldicoprobacter algeriensis]MCM8900593.1 phosphoadenosine phosphosulfate reductase family protein [Caldicoprobacter algeriensis]